MNRVFRFLVVALLTLIEAESIYAQIRVSSEKLIDVGYPTSVFVEPHLSINPANPNHQVIGVYMINPKSESDFTCVVIITFDSWKTQKLYKFSQQETGDPWTLITEQGTLLFSYLGGLNVHRSMNGGITWERDSVNLGQAHDHEVMVEDKSYGRFRGSIYISSIIGINSIFIARSDNQGKTFSIIRKWKFSNLNTNTWTPVVQSDGTLIVPFTTFQRQGILKSVWLKSGLSWLVKSTDGGNTFSTPSFICESCGKGFPMLTNDLSNSKYKDRLYFICANPETKQIYLHYSPDQGEKWSDPIIVNQFTNREEKERPPFFGAPTAAVNKNGVLGVIWQDRKEDSSGKCQYLYFSASLDGGQSFLKPVKVSAKLSCPQEGNNTWAGERWKAGGEYLGLVTKPDGSFQAVWADSRSGYFQLYTATIAVDGSLK
jgi:hypothetical protein